MRRADNADQRLTPRGDAIGCVSRARTECLTSKLQAISEGHAALVSQRLPAAAWARQGFDLGADRAPRTAAQVLSLAGATLKKIEAAVHREAVLNPPDAPLESELLHPAGPAAAAAAAAAAVPCADAVPTLVAPIARDSVEIAVKYGDYVKRQEREVARMQRSQGLRLPEDLNYNTISSLSCEEVEKLSRVRPRTLQEAAQISGVTPCCVSMLLFHLRKHGSGKQSKHVKVAKLKLG